MVRYLELSLAIKAYREHNDLSKHDVANETGLSWRTIHRLETGSRNARLETIQALCKLMEKEPKEFIV